MIAGTILALVGACSGETSGSPSPEHDVPPTLPPRADPAVPDLDSVPPLDLSRATVEAADVVYDTFDGSFIAVDRASDAEVRRLRDAIRPIYDPQYQTAEQAEGWLSDRDRVIGVEADGVAFAYPTKTLAFREIVNETFDGVPAVVTYCPLCGSGVVFDRRVGGRTLLIGNTSALYDHDMVMYDHETGTYWHQTSGRAIVGELVGEELEPLASLITTFGEWRELHPFTFVLSNSFEQAARRTDSLVQIQSSVNAERFFFPVTDAVTADKRVDLGAEVLMVRLAGQSKAYAIDDLLEAPANDVLGGVPLAVFASDARGLAGYVARTGDLGLTFDKNDDGLFVDRETSSTWDFGGRAIDGNLAGSELTLVPARRAMWFSIAGSNPDIALWNPEG